MKSSALCAGSCCTQDPAIRTTSRDLFEALCVESAAHAAAQKCSLYAPMLEDDTGHDPSCHTSTGRHEINREICRKLDTDTLSEE